MANVEYYARFMSSYEVSRHATSLWLPKLNRYSFDEGSKTNESKIILTMIQNICVF